MFRLILIVLFVFSTLQLFPQTPTKQGKTYTININNKDESVQLSVLSKKVQLNTNKDLTYYWYASNKLMKTQGGYDGKLLHGQYVSFYLFNNLKEKGKFKKGLKNGEWLSWYENGKIKEVANWKNGLRKGKYQLYNEAGELVTEGYYKQDKQQCLWTNYQSGKIVSQKKYRKGLEIIPKPKSEKKEKTVVPKKEKSPKVVIDKQEKEIKKEKKPEVQQEIPKVEKKTYKQRWTEWQEKIKKLFKKKSPQEQKDKKN